MNYQEFQKCAFPEKSAFDRKQFDFTTNLVKWLAMRVAFIFYKMGFTANAVDIFALITSVFGAFLVSTMTGEYSIFIVVTGVFLLAFGVFVDFVDGPIAKARGECSAIGDVLDNFGVDFVKLSLLVVFGILSSESYLIVINILSAAVLFSLVPTVSQEIEQNGLWSHSKFLTTILKLYNYKYSFLGVRVMIPLLLIVLLMFAILSLEVQLIARVISGFYIFLAAVWLYLIARI